MNRTRLDAMISATLTFFGVLLIVAFAIGVSSRGALKGPDAFVLRWTVISLMVAFSALVAWLRWKFFLLPQSSSRPGVSVAAAQIAEPSPPADLSSRAHGRLNPPRTRLPGPKSSNAPVRAASEPSPDIVAASRQAIVFRQHFPPPHRDSALSFFGGTPAVPRREIDEFWSWLADKRWLVRFVITDAVTMSVEASLNDSQEAAARIPADVARRVHGRHALAVQSEQGLFARTPDRMLAPPVDVQGYQWDRAKTHLLLLELSSNDGLGHHFGEGVYQFWITPADLRARRFDKVELTADAY
jgi:hypothetical protein